MGFEGVINLNQIEQSLKKLLPSGELAVSFRKVEQEADALLLGKLNQIYLSAYESLKPSPRRIQWSESRRSEIAVLEKLTDGRVSREDILTSLSHTHLREAEEYVLAIAHLRSDPQSASGIGIDFENTNRVMTSEVRALLVTAHDSDAETLTTLDFWIIKEACFKSHPQNVGTSLPQYSVASFDRESGLGTASGPSNSLFSFLLLRSGSFTVAIAISVSPQNHEAISGTCIGQEMKDVLEIFAT